MYTARHYGMDMGSVAASAFLVVVCYWCFADVLERVVLPLVLPPQPHLSYGQQIVLVMGPIAAVLGATLGLCASPARRFGTLGRAKITMIVGFLGAAMIGALWHSQVARYGRDRSELILYAPLLFVSLLLIMLGLLLMVRGRFRNTKTGPAVDSVQSQGIAS